MNNRHIEKILDRPEVENIKNDIRSLKSNGTALAKDLKHDGSAMVRESLDHIKATGAERWHQVENRAKGVSGRTLAAGLVAGLVLGYLCKQK